MAERDADTIGSISFVCGMCVARVTHGISALPCLTHTEGDQQIAEK
jgi:hypothetical protein